MKLETVIQHFTYFSIVTNANTKTTSCLNCMHLQDPQSTLGQTKLAGLTLYAKKCVWAKQKEKYLGYQLSNGKIRAELDKFKAMLFIFMSFHLVLLLNQTPPPLPRMAAIQ